MTLDGIEWYWKVFDDGIKWYWMVLAPIYEIMVNQLINWLLMVTGSWLKAHSSALGPHGQETSLAQGPLAPNNWAVKHETRTLSYEPDMGVGVSWGCGAVGIPLIQNKKSNV